MKCFKYSNRPKSYITVTKIEDPYDDGSGSVVSIGCTLKGDMQNPTWKVHVPLDLAVSVGQELIRIANLEREKNEKLSQAKTMPFRSEQRKSFVEKPRISLANEVKDAEADEDVKMSSDRAVEEGRVIKRTRKAVV